jgi:hypothetical protein
LVGRKFAIEVGRDRLRKDAFFAFRIEPVGPSADDVLDVPAALSLRTPGNTGALMPPLDPVQPIVALWSAHAKKPEAVTCFARASATPPVEPA